MGVSSQLAWRYLRGRGLRSLLTAFAVTVGVTLVFGLQGVIPTMSAAFTHSLMAGAGAVDLRVASSFNQPFDPEAIDTVSRTTGVAAASGVVERPVPVPPNEALPAAERILQVTVTGVDLGSALRAREQTVTQGRALAVGDGDVALLTADVASRLGVTLGDDLVLPSSVGSTTFTIVGLLDGPSVPGEDLVYVPLDAAQHLFAFGSKITGIEASVTPGADRATVEEAVRRALGSDYQVGGVASNSSLLASLEVSEYTFTMFGIFALATAGFIILNSFRTLVAERRRDLGMLRAIGMGRRSITRMILAEALLIGVLGTALGLVGGWGMANGLFALMGPMFEQVARVRLEGATFLPSAWVMAIGLGIGVTLLAALLPARAAGRVTALEAMRPAVGEVYQREVGVRAWVGAGLAVGSVFLLVTGQPTLVGVGAVVFLIAIALLAPAIIHPLADGLGRVVELAFPREGALARSNLQRNPGRSANTVTAVMLGLASIVAMMSVVASVFVGFFNYIDRSMGSDYIVMPTSIVLSQGNVAASPELADRISHTAGVGSVASLRVAQGRSGGEDVQVIGIDPHAYGRVASFEWNAPTTDAALEQLTSGRWVIANGIYASQHGLASGDALTLDTPAGPRTYFVAGIGNDYLNAKVATIYTSQANLTRDFSVRDDLMLLVDRRPDADPEATLAALQKIVTDYPAFHLYRADQWRAEQMETFNQSMIIFYGLIAALAIPSLVALANTLAMSVLARTREIGMLRAVGATRRQVRRMVLAESTLLTLIGSLLAVLAGLWLGYALVMAMANVGWAMPYVTPWGAVAATFVVGAAFGVLAAIGPARSAAQQDVIAALHHE